MAPRIIVTIPQMNTMATNRSINDLELGGSDIESLPPTHNSINNSIGQNMTGTSEGADTSSQSDLWGSTYNDDQSNSNDTGCSPSTSNPGSRQSSTATVSEVSLNIAKRENLAVMAWRLVMFGVLILTTVAAAVVVFLAVHRGEKSDFETSFNVDSQKIYESLGYSMDTRLEAVDSLALMMVSSARQRGETWPYTTFPSFASKTAKIRMLSDAIAIQQYQYVEEDQRSQWESWAKDNEAWVQETIDIQREDTTLRMQVNISDYDTNHSISIRYGGPVANNTGPYTPTWHTYPMLPSSTTSAYNFNAIQHPLLGPGVKKVIQDHGVVIGPVLNFEDE